MPRFEIKLRKTFARIPETLRRVFLHQTRRKRHAFGGRFEQRIELPQRNRALLAVLVGLVALFYAITIARMGG